METNIQNLITSKNNTGYIHHEGKQVKITVKELSKNTTACEACRAAKKKCNGLSPCSRCVLKKQECVFTTLQKRRGPDKDRKRKREETPAAVIDTETPPTSLNTARMECQMLDIVEAGTLDNFYGNFVKMVFPLTIHNLLHPTSTAQQVQSYTALAYIARISGVPDIARKYISQARVISGDIYDCFDADAVSAMLVFSYYWGLDNNTKLSQFYYGVACGLADEVPPSMLKGSVGVLSGLKKILGNQYYSYKQKGQIMKEATNKYMWDPSINDIISREFMFFSSDFIAFCNFCPIIQGGYAGVMEKKFQIFDNLTLSEEDRLQVHRSIDLIQQAVDKCLDIYKSPQIQAFYEFELPMYRALIEFASGHTLEALNYAFLSSKGLNKLLEGQSLGALSDISMLLLMGSCARLLNRHGQYNLAKNIIDVVKQVCKLMEPALNFILTDIDLITQAVPVLQPSTYPNMISNPNFAIFPNSSFSFTSTTINSSSIPHEISVTNTFVSNHSPLLNQLSSSPSSSFVFSPTEQNNLLNNFSPQHSIPFDDIPLLSNDLTILSHLESPRIEEL